MNDDDKLTPADGAEEESPRARRVDGARNAVSEPVVFTLGDHRIEGWALNISRGGLRAILEETVAENANVSIRIGDDADLRPGRVVWVRPRPDGAIVGVSFLDVSPTGSIPPSAPPSAPEQTPSS